MPDTVIYLGGKWANLAISIVYYQLKRFDADITLRVLKRHIIRALTILAQKAFCNLISIIPQQYYQLPALPLTT